MTVIELLNRLLYTTLWIYWRLNVMNAASQQIAWKAAKTTPPQKPRSLYKSRPLVFRCWWSALIPFRFLIFVHKVDGCKIVWDFATKLTKCSLNHSLLLQRCRLKHLDLTHCFPKSGWLKAKITQWNELNCEENALCEMVLMQVGRPDGLTRRLFLSCVCVTCF